MYIDKPIVGIQVPLTGIFMWYVMHSAWIVMHTLLLESVLHVDCNLLILYQWHDHSIGWTIMHYVYCPLFFNESK